MQDIFDIFNERLPQKSAYLDSAPPFENPNLNEGPVSWLQ